MGVTTETELALAIQDKERYIRLDGHIGLTGAFKSPQVRGHGACCACLAGLHVPCAMCGGGKLTCQADPASRRSAGALGATLPFQPTHPLPCTL